MSDATVPTEQACQEALAEISARLARSPLITGFGIQQANYPQGPGCAVCIYLSRAPTAEESKTIPTTITVSGLTGPETVKVFTEVIGSQQLQ